MNLWWKFCQGSAGIKIKVLEPYKHADLRRQHVEVIPMTVKLDDPAIMAISSDASVRTTSQWQQELIHHHPCQDLGGPLILFERMFAKDETVSKKLVVAPFGR
jgi:hypothetical protein